MAILNRNILDRVDCIKSRIDDSRLEIFVDGIFNHIIDKVMTNVPIQDADNRDRKDEVIDNFRKAWCYARRQPSFNQASLEEIAGLVEPSLRQGRPYALLRQESATLVGINYTPPIDEERIREDLEKMYTSVETGGLHPFEEAVFLYFHLMRIQPFSNGNKRTANIVMNTNLLREKLAPISIPLHEDELFRQYFEGALMGFAEDRANAVDQKSLSAYLDPGITQRQFYEYLAEKEKSNLTRVTDYLKDLNHYTILVESQSPAPVYTLKKLISGWFSRDREARPSKISLSPAKDKIEVIGEIPYFTLQKILESGKKRGINSYKIKVEGKKS